MKYWHRTIKMTSLQSLEQEIGMLELCLDWGAFQQLRLGTYLDKDSEMLLRYEETQNLLQTSYLEKISMHQGK